MYFLDFAAHFDRDKGLDQGRLCLRHLQKGTLEVWVSATSTRTKQQPESFHQRGGMLPPEYRCRDMNKWTVLTKPIFMPDTLGIEGNFYKINPHTVVTDRGGRRGDFGIHWDGRSPGSLGCIVMSADRFKSFESAIANIRNLGILEIPLFVTYS